MSKEITKEKINNAKKINEIKQAAKKNKASVLK